MRRPSSFPVPVLLLTTLIFPGLGFAKAPEMPIQPGSYVFTHRFAEHPEMGSISLQVVIEGRHIVLTNETPSDVLPLGVIAEGDLVWHARTNQWIIAQGDEDAEAAEVGACSDGPEVVDLVEKVYWSC